MPLPNGITKDTRVILGDRYATVLSDETFMPSQGAGAEYALVIFDSDTRPTTVRASRLRKPLPVDVTVRLSQRPPVSFTVDATSVEEALTAALALESTRV